MKFLNVVGVAIAVALFNLGSIGSVSAASGACSGHGGVDCSAGSHWDGSVICNDGWAGSSVQYSSMKECSAPPLSIGAMPAYGSGDGTCSSHEGIDCKAGADLDGSVICKDGWKDSSVSLLNVCKDELSLMNKVDAVATAQCMGKFIESTPKVVGVTTSGNIGDCIKTTVFNYYQAYDPSCRKGMMLSDRGGCFCLGYLSSGVCLSDVFINDVNQKYCGGPKFSTSVVLDIFNQTIEHGNSFFDLFIGLSCNKKIDSLSIALGSSSQVSLLSPVLSAGSSPALPLNQIQVDLQKNEESCHNALGAFSSWDAIGNKCICAPGYEVAGGKCITKVDAQKERAPKYFVGAPKSKKDLLNCFIVGNKSTKLYYLRDSVYIKNTSYKSNTCFKDEATVKKSGYRKSKLSK